ncbi:metallophosphoesterase [Paenibacillus sp. sgz302251]|uniref:metallophosphoesterase n=1 Tax=Paenibacillus sp. sgz302251 TaxID=3414493 RepID=UPI003C7C139F
MRKKKRKLYLIPLIILAFAAFLYFENNELSVTEFQISSSKLPEGFDSYRIVQLTDLHNKAFGKEQQRLVRKVSGLKPNLIVMTGDLVDSKRYNAEVSLTLMREMTKLAPVYYVTGNHEWASNRYETLEEGLLGLGVHVLRNDTEIITLGQGEIRMAGVDDPIFNVVADGDVDKMNEHISKALEAAEPQENDLFTILLSHRPELFSVYLKHKIDLTFSGHAHGGQVRVPFVGGLIAPGQGFWPKYDAGKYEEEGTTMIVSRGLGNSVVPQRLFNRPEVVLVELTRSNH